MNCDTRRAMEIVANEYNFDSKKLEALMREYSVTVDESFVSLIERIYPSPVEIATKFIIWLQTKKQMNLQKRDINKA